MTLYYVSLMLGMNEESNFSNRKSSIQLQGPFSDDGGPPARGRAAIDLAVWFINFLWLKQYASAFAVSYSVNLLSWKASIASVGVHIVNYVTFFSISHASLNRTSRWEQIDRDEEDFWAFKLCSSKAMVK